jgi:glycosyltransferase involved in cell wall biosynthesis
MHERERFSVLLAGDLPDAEQLEHVRRRGLQEQVRFTGIIVDAEQVLGCSDVGFVLSHKETLSYACRESMAAGLPVIVSAAGGLTENVDDGINGWVVPVRNPVAISRVLRQILDAPESVVAMGRAARQKSVREFGLEAFLASTCAVYQLASETAPVVQTTDPSVRAAVRLR